MKIMFIIIVIIMIVLYGLIHTYIATRFSQSLDLFPFLKKPAVILTILLGVFSILTFLFQGITPLAISFGLRQTTFFIGMSWIYIILMLLLFLVFIDFTRVINHFFHIYPNLFFINYPKTKFIIMIAVICSITFFYILGHLNFTSPEITELDVKINKKVENATPLNIIMASDIHLGYIVNKQKLQKYVKLINEQNPDIILLVGDITDSDINPVLDQKMEEELSQLKAKYGIYLVAGNHEYIGGGYEYKMNYYRSFGWNVLEDSAMLVNDKYYIVGRKDRSDRNRLDVKELTSKLDKNKPIILLDHQPYNLEKSLEAGVDLQFSGHTHKGQFFPINLITNAIYEIDYGYLQKGNTNIYVSSGLGLWGPPIRMGTKSELVKIKLITE